jgi:pyocin large subunit-like protein
VVLLLAAALLVLGAACQSTTSAAGQAGGAATSATPAGGAVVAPKAGQPSAPDAKPADTKPGTSKPADARPSAAKPGGAVEGDRERIAERATWAPGSLESHFEKHGREGPYRSAAEYDRAARDTIRTGTAFTYQDRESNARRQGYYDKTGNRFTGLTRDGARITTHFRPDRGEAYVRGLEDSTYR